MIHGAWQRRLSRDDDRKGLGIYANVLHTTAFLLSFSAFHDQKVPRYISSDYFGSSAFVTRWADLAIVGFPS